jgi:Amt family ammonium transporter
MRDIDLLWVILASALVFLMQAGFLCLESGMTRSKNSINVAIKNLADFCLSTLVFWVFGFGLMFGLSYQGWFGVDLFAVDFAKAAPSLTVFFLFQVMGPIFSSPLSWRGSYTPSQVIGVGPISGALADRAGLRSWGL